MYGSEDLGRFYVEYQSEWVPRGMTMRAFCDRNNVYALTFPHCLNRQPDYLWLQIKNGVRNE